MNQTTKSLGVSFMLSFELSAIDLILGIAILNLLILYIKELPSTVFVSWIHTIKRRLSLKTMFPNGPMHAKFRVLVNIAGLFLAFLGLATLAWIGGIVWADLTTWGKDVSLTFFGSRTGEPISLGIGMKVIHYFIIGLALLLSGSLTFRFRKWGLPNLIEKFRRRDKKKEKREGSLKTSSQNIEGQPMIGGFEEEIPARQTEIAQLSPRKNELERSSAHQTTDSSKCHHHFGYLGKLSNDTPLPDNCLVCSQIVECLGSPGQSQKNN